MYHFPGEYVTDFCIVRRDGLYHLFHIRGERWTWPWGYKEIDLGHAVSADLRVWTPLAPVVPAGEPGAWDESGVWAPDVFEHDDLYYLYYTGSDRANNQAIGLATSPDLLHWTNHPPNPVVVPGAWPDIAVGRDVAGRDAMVFHDAPRGRYLLYYTATLADGRACLALAESTDLVVWRDRGPTYIEDDRTYNRLESAYLVPHDGRYYLFYSAKGGPKSKGFAPQTFAHFDIVYLVADDPTGGWRKPANHELLLGTTCASEHPTFDGDTYMLYVVQEEIDGVWGASVLSDPKRIAWQTDGTARIVEHRPGDVTRRTLFDSAIQGYDHWIGRASEWRVESGTLTAADPARDSDFMDTLWGRDVVVEAEIAAGVTGVAALLVRANPSGLAGYQISLDFDRGALTLAARFPDRAPAIVQERPVRMDAGPRHTLRAVVQGKFLDVYVDGSLQLVHDLPLYADGCYGVHSRGPVAFTHIHAYLYQAPPVALPDWAYRTRPRYLFPE